MLVVSRGKPHQCPKQNWQIQGILLINKIAGNINYYSIQNNYYKNSNPITPDVACFTVKQNTRFREFYICFGCETKTGVRILAILQLRTAISHMNGKLSPIPFE